MSEKHLYTELEKELREICVHIKNKGRVMLQDYELTPPQFEALLHLNKAGELTLGELSGRMYLACSTITDLLDRMEKTELVLRVKDAKDKRISRVKVLPRGHAVIASVLEARQTFLKGALAQMDEAALMALLNTITHLNHCLLEE